MVGKNSKPKNSTLSAEHPKVCFFLAKRGCFHSLFSSGTLLTMENFPWQLTDCGKFSLVSHLPLEKNLATYQGLFKLPQTCSRVTTEKKFSPEKFSGIISMKTVCFWKRINLKKSDFLISFWQLKSCDHPKEKRRRVFAKKSSRKRRADRPSVRLPLLCPSIRNSVFN